MLSTLYLICSNTVSFYNDTFSRKSIIMWTHEQILGMITDPRCASLFLSNTVRNLIKQHVDDDNCDEMIDRRFKPLQDA